MPHAMKITAALLVSLAPFAVQAAVVPTQVAPAAMAPVGVSAADHIALAPDVTVGPHGEIAVMWLDRGVPAPAAADGSPHQHNHVSSMDIYVAVAPDGKTFGAPQRVNQSEGEVWGFPSSRPRIAFGPTGTLHVGYPANAQHPKLAKPVLTMRYTRSTDGGKSFEASRRLSTLVDVDLSHELAQHGGFTNVAGFGTLGVAPDGSVHLLWIDTRQMKSATDNGSVYGVVSRDDGRTFSQDRPETDDSVCPCCQLSVAFDVDSRAFLGSRLVTRDGVRTSSVARASGDGDRFGPRISTGGTPWHINGCPLKPTVLAVRGTTIYTAAHNGAEQPPAVMIATSLDGGTTFGTPQAVHPGALVSDAPSIALAGDRAIVAWHAKTDGPRRVYYRTLDASGAPIGTPVALTSGEVTSQNPALAPRLDGRVQIAWQQDNRIYTTAIDPAAIATAPALAAASIPLVTPGELRTALDAERGKVVVLNLWASWCAPCLREIPDLVRIERDLASRGVVLIGVSMDEPGDAARVAAFHTKYFPEFRTYLRGGNDLDAIASVVDPAWNEVLPTTYVLARDGKLARRVQGGKTHDEFRTLIESVL